MAAGAAWQPPLAVGVLGLLAASRRRPLLRAAGIASLALGLGALAAGAEPRPSEAMARLAAGAPRCRVEGTLREHLGGLGTLVSVGRAACSGGTFTGGIVALPSVDADVGAPLRATGLLIRLDPADMYDRARLRFGAGAELLAEEVRSGAPTSPPLRLAARVREGLRASARPLHMSQGALLRGLTIGDVRDLPQDEARELRRAGLSHLVAVSGSNVAIVLGALLAATRRLPLGTRVAVAAAGLLLFVLVVGPEPSVLRAAAMGAVGLAALIAGTRAPPLHALALAIAVVVAFRPGLVHSPGLHLSAAATAGIVLWTPSLARLIPLPPVVATVLAVTVAAQTAVLPVLIATFGEVPVTGAAANLLAAPAVPFATILGFGAAALGAVWPAAGELAARLAAPGTAWILRVGDIFGSPSWAVVSVSSSWAVVSGAAVAVLAVRSLSRSAEIG